MKKSVLALALFGAFAGAASAQTSVTIYGIVDAAFARENKGAANATDATKPGGVTTRLDSGGQSGSRLGFKGTEDLGDGLSAIFTLENGFNIDNGNLGQGSRFFGRQAWVGLQGGFGTFKLGRQKTLMRDVIESIDPFALGMGGSADRYFSDNGGGFRADNTISYSLPGNLNGFFGNLSYSFGEQADHASGLRQIGFSGGYANGPLNISLAYNNINNPATYGSLTATSTASLISGASTIVAAFPAPLPAATAGLDGSNKSTLLGGFYDFGVAKFHIGYAWNKWDASTSGRFANLDDSRNGMVGVSVPFGASSFLASFVRHEDRLNVNRDWNALSLGYTYSLSKRTNFYTSLARTAFDDAATTTGTNGNAVSVDRAGENNTFFNVGLRHKF